MKIEQIYTGCLAHGAYFIESEGEAAIIDPLREVEPYLQRAAAVKASIKYIFESHFHADFVSGHLDLAARTGARIIYGPTASPAFDAYVAYDGEVFKLGKITITLIHTPGHTMESSCFLLQDENGKANAIFTGDTLFIGDVGRPDLAQKLVPSLTQEVLAGHLYDSLRNKVMPLPGDIIVYPGHGAGSACGKNMSRETTDTLAHQKEVNYALHPGLKKEEFIATVLDGLVTPPGYFPSNVLMNMKGYDSINDVMKRGLQALGPQAFEAAANETNAIILDTRSPEKFAEGFIPNSINIGLDGSFAPWVGTLIADIRQPLLIIAENKREKEVITRLARVGYDHAVGYLEGGFDAWKKAGFEIDRIENVSATELAVRKGPGEINIIDVRKKNEYISEHLPGAINLPLDFVNDSMQEMDREKTYFVHCASGYRSVIFISILKARGYDQLINIKGGIKALKESGKFRVTDYVCPSSQL